MAFFAPTRQMWRHLKPDAKQVQPENIFVILGRENLIPLPLAEKMAGMVRFRNILVHGYLVVDPVKVQSVLANDLGLFLEFAQAIQDLLERDEKANGEEEK